MKTDLLKWRWTLQKKICELARQGMPVKRMGARSWIHGNEDGFTEMEMDALK